MSDVEHVYDGCSIPPEIYAAGMGWDPQPEVERLLFLAHEAGVHVRSALELGCGTGRLVAPMAERVSRIVGVELNPQMAAMAQQAVAARFADRVSILTGDMCAPALDERFDLVFASPNTLRHVLDDSALERFWRGVDDHLKPGGVFIADLELGNRHEQRSVSRPQCWTVARDGLSVDVRWEVIRAPQPDRPCSLVRWTFCRRSDAGTRCWAEEFPLRVFAIETLVAAAARTGGLSLFGVFENRDPYLLPRAPRELDGRYVVIFTRAV